MEQSKPRTRIIQTLSILAVLVLFYAALWVLRKEVKISHYQEVFFYLKQIPIRRFLVVMCFSLMSYLALTFYDVLGLRHIHRHLSYGRTALTSFIAYTFSHNIGASVLTGGSIRYRLYSKWGLTAGEAANVLLICGMTFWVGFLSMGAVFFFLEPPDLPASIRLPFNSVFSAGIFCLAAISIYLLGSIFFRRTIKIMRWHFPTPTLPIALGQMAAGCADWTCSGAALFLLLPPSTLTFPSFMAIYLLAQIVGFASQVPGGLGILETVVVLLLSPIIQAPDVLGALLAFRLAYYLIPFVLGLIAFALSEIVRNKEGFKRALQIMNRWAPDFAPHVFAFLAFIAGSVLLASDVLPEVNRRLTWLNEFMPLPVLEASHLIVGLAGAGLLVVARGLQQRLESAYVVALVLLGTGVLGCLFKGFDYEESMSLLAIGAALLFSRRYFPRKASIFQQRYPPLWVAAIMFVWLGCIWIGFFNYRYEGYSQSLWTTFDVMEDASRFLRASLGATFVLSVFSVISLLSPFQPETEAPTSAELQQAWRILHDFRRSYGALALLGDKALLFNRKSDAFLMYAIEGKSWVTLGDPVGSKKEQQELALKFRDLCRRNKASSVFFGVDQDHFKFYLDMGLTVLKMGEEARVPLKTFHMASISSGDLKNSQQKAKEAGDVLDLLHGAEIQPFLPELRKVSEEWLSKNKTREKSFLTGFFQEDFLDAFPLAVVRKEGKIAAFAVLCVSAADQEASLAMLRSSADAPSFLEDFLRMELILWAQAKGFHYFNLGTAPLLDMEESPLAPFTSQMAEILSPYENVQHLQDIRKDKERFHPEWSPKYLAVAGNLPLPVAFNNIQSLVARGSRISVI